MRLFSGRSKGSNKIDMLNGTMWDKILLFAVPLAVSSMMQQLFNSVDAAVVGRYASSQALAAVGSNGPIVGLMVNMFVGLAIGANVVIAKHIGAGETDRVSGAVHTAMAVSIASGLMLLLLGQVIARPILTLMQSPHDVIDLATLYLRILFLGMPFMMFYNFGAAVLRSVGDTRRPLYTLIFAGIVNVILNLILVIKFEMGVSGVAIATIVSQLISAAVVFVLLKNEEELIRLELSRLRIVRDEFVAMLRVGIPSGLQGICFSISNVTIQSGINTFGSYAVAGSSAALYFEMISFFMMNGFTQAAVTFTSQNYGAMKFDRCRSAFRISLVGCAVFTGALNMLFMLFRGQFLSFFTVDPQVVEFASTRMLFAVAFSWVSAPFEIAGGALRGLGRSSIPMVITLLGTCVFRLIWVFAVCPMYPTFEVLIAVYPLSWLLTDVFMVAAYLRTRERMFAVEI